MKHNKVLTYFLAFCTVLIWGSTFISTKILLDSFSPMEIIIIRFACAYLCMFAVYPKFHKITHIKNEILLVLAALCGGSLYFLAENFALDFSLASNVSLLVSTAPIITAIFAHYTLKDEPLTTRSILGALVAFAGVSLVIYNGKFILKLNPLGDMLALLASICWALYTIIIRKMNTNQHPLYITRKIFFYTLVTLIPVCFFYPPQIQLSRFAQPVVLINVLFLTVFASCAAYLTWNYVIKTIGPVKANNLIYFVPVFTLIESSLLLKEPLAPIALIGATLIFFGVLISSKFKLPTKV